MYFFSPSKEKIRFWHKAHTLVLKASICLICSGGSLAKVAYMSEVRTIRKRHFSFTSLSEDEKQEKVVWIQRLSHISKNGLNILNLLRGLILFLVTISMANQVGDKWNWITISWAFCPKSNNFVSLNYSLILWVYHLIN